MSGKADTGTGQRPFCTERSEGLKVLIADHRLLAGDLVALQPLKASGVNVIVNPHGRRLTNEELIELGHQCAGVIAGSERYTADILDQLPELRCISRVGVGTDNVDLDAARERGVEVCTTPDAPTRAVAEFTVGLIMALTRGIVPMDRDLHAGRWHPRLGRELLGTRVGLVGLGRIGRLVAAILSGCSCDLYGCDVVSTEGWAETAGVRVVSFEELLQAVDVVSLHVPHTSATHHLMNRRTFGLMRAGAFVINTSRGGLVDEDALYASLAEGHLGGAALDVFSNEPYTGPLAALDSVILTPHAASQTAVARGAMEREAVANLMRVLSSNR